MNSTIGGKINKVSFIVIFTLGLITGCHDTNAQTVKDVKSASSTPLLSRLTVLSIHVSNTTVHDSVFHLLTDKLGLSVTYKPENYANRRYAMVYAGNLHLEPCGPFSNFTYASKNFKAIFLGLNWGSQQSIASIAGCLNSKNIKMEQGDNKHIQVTDTSIIKHNIYFGITTETAPNKLDDSLRTVMLENNKNRLGIERVKEVRVGYKDKDGMDKWKEIIKPSELSKDGLWKPASGPSIRLVKSDIREVNAVVFKVKSLKKAKSYLIENNLLGAIYKNEIALDKSRTFGISILLSEE